MITPEPRNTAHIPTDYNTTKSIFVNGIAGIVFKSQEPPQIIRTYVPLRINGKFAKAE